MAETFESLGAFDLVVDDLGVAVATFSRPPVNAISMSVYKDIGRLVDRIEGDPSARVLILTARNDARAWCGGADLNDFVGMNPERREERYAIINGHLPRFYRMDRPVIAAINGSAVGVGMILAALCDLRIAAEDASFSCPEIDYGLIAGGGGLFAHLNMPEAKVREMLFTGARFTARTLEPTGFFNYVLPKADVLPKARQLAEQIAVKSLPVIRARKDASVNLEGQRWYEAYVAAQAQSVALAAARDGGEGVSAFLQKRGAQYADR